MAVFLLFMCCPIGIPILDTPTLNSAHTASDVPDTHTAATTLASMIPGTFSNRSVGDALLAADYSELDRMEIIGHLLLFSGDFAAEQCFSAADTATLLVNDDDESLCAHLFAESDPNFLSHKHNVHFTLVNQHAHDRKAARVWHRQ